MDGSACIYFEVQIAPRLQTGLLLVVMAMKDSKNTTAYYTNFLSMIFLLFFCYIVIKRIFFMVNGGQAGCINLCNK